jgi:nicotinate-nucleotide adenylyltransferase
MRPLAIFGGTFDPIHLGHLCAAWEAAEALDADVRLMPANVPPHRPPPIADASTRVAILRTALGDQDRLTVDTRELDRDGPSFTVDTLTGLRAEIGPRRPLVLLVGADAFAGLWSWHRWHELFALAHIGVLTRPGPSLALDEALEAEVAPRRCRDAADLRTSPAGRVLDIAVTSLDISATHIRDELAAGRQPRYLLHADLFDDPTLLDVYRRTDA